MADTVDARSVEGKLARIFPLDQGDYLIETPHDWAVLTADVLEDLSTFLRLSREETLLQLRSYAYGRMAVEWKQTEPTTQEEMRRFYEGTDAYVWSLTLWQAARKYEWYHGLISACARLQGAEKAREDGKLLHALDYGSGIGTSALWLAEMGYHVTVADVDSPHLRYTQHRLVRHHAPYNLITVMEDFPPLWSGPYDLICCYDVLEHVQDPERVFLHLTSALRPGGLVSVVAPFDAQTEQEGYHLRENYLRFGEGRWPLWLSGHGWSPLPGSGGSTWRRVPTWTGRLARRAHYSLWRLTGLDVRYKRPVLRG